MKVIFLDVDGVLNSEKDLLNAKGDSEIFDRPLKTFKTFSRFDQSKNCNFINMENWMCKKWQNIILW